MKNTNTDIHRKVEAMLREHGLSPMRQLEPKKDDAVGQGELFELWRNDAGKVLWVHFYGDSHGVEFYVQGTTDNTWDSVVKLLGTFRS